MAYTPTPGWFDLTERPKGMSEITHKKIQDQQMIVIAESAKYKDVKTKRDNQFAYDQLREIAAKLQQIILNHWPHEMLFK